MEKRRKKIIGGLLLIYGLVLVKLIVFKYPYPMTREVLRTNSLEGLKFRLEHINLRPFKGIYEFLFINKDLGLGLRNVLGNIIVFMPLGFIYGPVYRRDKTKFSPLTLGILISLALELIQLLTGLGEFDVDDIILNSLGSYLGYIFFRLLKKYFNKKLD